MSSRHLTTVREPRSLTVRAPAKVNLHLAVGPKRRDGFHELHTVYQAVGLYDEVTLTDGAERLTVTVTGEGAASVPQNEDNLAARAVRAVASVAGRVPAVTVGISKGIPVAGGMAGGSADAAAAMFAAEQVFRANLDRATLARLAAGIGSDVPFLLVGGTALGTGRGELVSPVMSRGAYHWVFALAEGGLETPRVYAELDRIREQRGEEAGTMASPDGVLAAVRAGDVVALGKSLHNDLQEAAVRLRPQLARLLDAGREAGAVGGVVSGSGPTVAFLARGSDDAISLASRLAGSGLCRTVRHAAGPVPGVKVVG